MMKTRQSPVLPDQTQTADPGVCQAAVTVVAPATSDNCGVASVSNDYNGTTDASDTYPVGTTTVTWTVTDIHGNTKPVHRISRLPMMKHQRSPVLLIRHKQLIAGVCQAAVTVVAGYL